MSIAITSAARIGALLAGLCGAANAQTIYPLDRAEILTGARFDFKVEFPDGVTQDAATVTIKDRKSVV